MYLNSNYLNINYIPTLVFEKPVRYSKNESKVADTLSRIQVSGRLHQNIYACNEILLNYYVKNKYIVGNLLIYGIDKNGDLTNVDEIK